ncbi:hypothetical protein K2Z84_24230 [Candidatus Binatia bacterium]|nr:hypothetical protein [Candidatus Binatia bacterium]
MGKHGWSRGGMRTAALAGLTMLLVSSAVHAQGNPVPDSTEDSTFSAYGAPTGLEETPAEQDAFSANRPIAPAPWNRAVSANLSLGSMLINAVFFPVKLAVGIVGAEVGGIAGAANGGDEEAARGVWNVTTDGSYFVTPADLDGRGQFTLGSDAP